MAISTPASIGTFNNGASSTTIAFVTSGAAAAGSKIWLAVQFFSIGGFFTTITSVADDGAGGSLTWRTDSQGQAGSPVQNGLAIISADAPSGLASGTTVTITLSFACVDRKVSGFYSTGVQTGDVDYGAVAQNQASNTNWSSTPTTVASGDILIGAGVWEDGVPVTSTPTGGNTEIDDFGASGHSLTSVYQIGTGASIAAQGTWSQTSAAVYGCRSAAVAYPAAAAPGSYPGQVLADSPLGYWRLGEPSGATAADSSGNARDGTYNGTPVYGQPSLLPTVTDNTAVQVTGDDYVGCTNAAAFQLTTGSLEAWFKTSDASASYHAITVKQLAFSLFVNAGILLSYDWGASQNRSTGVNVADGLPHHVVLTFDSGVSNGTKIYIDGTLVLTTTMTVSAQTQPLEIGRGDSTGDTQYLVGTVDEVAIYGTILTQARVTAHFNAAETSGTLPTSAFERKTSRGVSW